MTKVVVDHTTVNASIHPNYNNQRKFKSLLRRHAECFSRGEQPQCLLQVYIHICED